VSLLTRPDAPGPEELPSQTAAAYCQLNDALSSQGMSLENMVRETVFFRDIERDLDGFLAARERVLVQLGKLPLYRPASTLIEQAPLEGRLRVQVFGTAVVPQVRTATTNWVVEGPPVCTCESCTGVHARVILVRGEKHIHTGNIYGRPGSTFDETMSMFRSAESLLRKAGADFHSVVRTWIYLRDMERDYAEFNRARRAFFQETGISLRPASTGIDGVPFPREHNLTMGLYAVHCPGFLEADVMTTPTLNEAWEYGSDFSRGLKVRDANKTALYVSGTASVDEEGRTVHVGDFEGQVDRMLLNVAKLLERENASFDDVVAAITYLKNPADTPRLLEILSGRRLNSFPHAVVKAAVCRPDLLCEMEATALLPR
jgi:enamine deaminase RidA (YjgF/YER057c/UK114 family)